MIPSTRAETGAISSLPLVPLSPEKDTSADIAALTSRLAAGDELAFRELHGRYFDSLYRYLLIVTDGNAHDAQDALQAAFLRMARHARTFDTEEAFWNWLRAIARNLARDVGRKERRYLGLLRRYTETASPPERSVPRTAAWREHLEEAVAELAPGDRDLIRSKYLFGATVAELAASTGHSEKSVESRLLRLRRDLADRILKKIRAS